MGNFTSTAPVTSYLPNNFGFYCMSGNAAEMVVYKDGTPGTKGGSWQSHSQAIQINGNDKFIGQTKSSTQLGFRPLIQYLD